MLRAKRKSRGDQVFGIVNGVLLAIMAFLVLYPLYFSLIASFSSPNAVYQGRVIFLPADITLQGYEKIFTDPSIWTSYLNSIVYTLVGTLCNLVFTIPLAFALSRREFPLHGVYMKLMAFTMYFYGGIIPLYFVVKDLHLLDTMWSLILPTVIATYNLIIARSFFISNIPEELKEAAFLDGCGYIRFFFSVVMPLSKAIVAVMALFFAARLWTGYFEALIYMNTEAKFPLQLILRTILIESQNALQDAGEATTVKDKQELVNLLKYGCVIVSSVPMLLFYPFVQKYFVKGVMIGAVKG